MKGNKTEIEDQSERKRILYVDSGWDPDGMETVANALRELGELVTMHGLSKETIETVRDALKTRPFDAMVSHLPAARGARCGWRGIEQVLSKYSSYGPAFGLLGQIRALSDMPILVYTGAGRDNIPALAWDSSGVDMIIHKGGDTKADAQELVGWVRYEWNRLPEKPEALQIERSADGASLQMETILCQTGGLGPFLSASIVKQFGSLSGSIETINSDGSVEEKSSLGDMLGMMGLCAAPGSRLRIRLDDATPEAEEALRAAHHLLSQKYL